MIVQISFIFLILSHFFPLLIRYLIFNWNNSHNFVDL